MKKSNGAITKQSYLVFSAVLFLLAVSCGGDGHREFRDALTHQYRMMEEFAAAAAAASNPKAAAAALEKFRSEAVAGREWMARLAVEHPGLAALDKEHLPDDLRAVLERVEAATGRFITALRGVEERFGGDPSVRKGLDEMGSVLSVPPR